MMDAQTPTTDGGFFAPLKTWDLNFATKKTYVRNVWQAES